MPTERRPNLFIVGAQKAGTSALAGWLRQHPEVCMSFPKEPGYLAFGERGYTFPDGRGRPAPASTYVVKDYDTYLGLFAGASEHQRVLGEASTWYLQTPGMAQTIRQFNPEAKIIVIFRHPVERAYSAWCHARRDRVEPCEDFAAALALEERRGEVEFLLRYRAMGLYSAALQSYLETFAPERVLVLRYDDLRADPAALWRQVCAFLDIDAGIEPPFERRYNRSGDPRSRALQSLLRSHRLKGAVRSVVPHRIGLWVKERLDAVNLRDFPPMDEQTRSDLLTFYRQDVAELQRLTGMNLESWQR